MTTFLAPSGPTAPARPTTYLFAAKAGLRTQLPAKTLGWPLVALQDLRPLPAPSQHVVSSAGLSTDDFLRRTEAAQERADALAEKYQKSLIDNQYGCEILWHPRFGAYFLGMVRDTPLHETVSILNSDCPWSNWGDTPPQLDLIDYGYLADLLREELAEATTVGKARLRLERALWWVETRAGQLPAQA